jgi:hypothetical protein
MAGSRGRFRGRHGLGRGTQAEHRGRGGNAAVGRGPPDRTAQDAVHQGSAPAASAAGRGGGILLLDRLMVVARLLASGVKQLLGQ